MIVLGDGAGQARDVTGVYRRFLDEPGATTYISRPDFYVFGTAAGPQETATLVDDLVAQLHLLTASAPA